MKLGIGFAVLLVALLHHDIFLWDNKTLVFGFLPAGLAYHILYSFVAAGIMLVLVRYMWPAELEED